MKTALTAFSLFAALAVASAQTIVTNLADSGPGTLRSAISNAAPGDTITFDPALAGKTNVLTSGELLITNNLTIDASALPGGFKISGTNQFARVFEVAGNTLVTLDSLTIQDGYDLSGFGGGGILFTGASLTLTNCTLSGNAAASSGSSALGGGIAAYGSTLTINNSTFSGNSASGPVGGRGGGIYVDSSAGLTINNSTFSGNQADDFDGFGGGIFIDEGTLTINSSTFSGNSAGSDGGGIYAGPIGILHLTDTIVAGNFAPSLHPNIFFSGSFFDHDNLTSGNPLLAPLGNYGGPTQTMPPLFGSPAIDAGLDSVTNFLATDQRGYSRLSGAHVDIGAVEAQWASTGSPPLLNSPALGPNGAFSFGFNNASNTDFTVLATTNIALPLAQWSILGQAVQIAPGQYQFTDAAATNSPQQFYRVVSP